MRGALLAALLFVITLLTPNVGVAQSRLDEFLPQLTVAEMFPGADRLGPVEGAPPAAAAYAGDTLLGYVFLNADVVNATGYSGKPIFVAVALDLDGTIVGAKLLKHSEPIVLIGIPERRITDYIQGHVGFNVLRGRGADPQARERRRGQRGGPPVDIVSGATVTVLVIGDTMIRSSLRIARAHGIGGVAPAPAAEVKRSLDMTQQGTRTWETLLGEGAIRRLHLTSGDVNQAFQAAGLTEGRPVPGPPQDSFIDLYTALVSVPVIGRSLLGANEYRLLRDRLQEGQHAILVMGRGDYSWRGSGYVRGGIFDRIELVQDLTAVRFRDRDYKRLGQVVPEDAPFFPEVGLFVIPAGVEFDPTDPWDLQLLVQREVGALQKEFLAFELPYGLPEPYLAPLPAVPAAAALPEAPFEPEAPLWQRIWDDRLVDLVILGVMLGVLTLIFFFQDWLVKRPRLQYWVRTVFLAWTLLWLGWWVLAQLSVVNILTLTNSVISGFSWDYFLMDPLLFVLWSAVAASLLFWARGAFCGWLCPFGALQEFVNRFARLVHIPQITVPWGLHERLWAVKYVIFLGLFGVALYELAFAERLAEVEPFKTAIVLHFIRDWPFVIYAVGLLVAGLFIERFFCRYLCPLGAGLAIPARLRMFEWLKRHRECGQPCQRCAVECPVASIHPDGRINPNECIYCMHCQLLYWDDHKCPAMIQRRLKRERTSALSSKTSSLKPPLGSRPTPKPSAANPAGWEGRGPATGSPPSPPRD